MSLVLIKDDIKTARKLLTFKIMLLINILIIMVSVALVRTSPTYAYSAETNSNMSKNTTAERLISVEQYTSDGKRLIAYERAKKIAAIGTEEEIEVVGYNITKVMQIITAENRYDKYNCYGAAQCLYNACKQSGWTITPDEMCILKNYTEPLTWISDEAYRAVVDIFIRNKTFDIVENATMFYNPAIYGLSKDHEVQRFVVEINGIYYYEETVGVS